MLNFPRPNMAGHDKIFCFHYFRYINKVLIIIDRDLRDGLRMSRKRNRNLENNGWINVPNTNLVGRCECNRSVIKYKNLYLFNCFQLAHMKGKSKLIAKQNRKILRFLCWFMLSYFCGVRSCIYSLSSLRSGINNY